MIDHYQQSPCVPNVHKGDGVLGVTRTTGVWSVLPQLKLLFIGGCGEILLEGVAIFLNRVWSTNFQHGSHFYSADHAAAYTRVHFMLGNILHVCTELFGCPCQLRLQEKRRSHAIFLEEIYSLM